MLLTPTNKGNFTGAAGRTRTPDLGLRKTSFHVESAQPRATRRKLAHGCSFVVRVAARANHAAVSEKCRRMPWVL